MRDAHGLGRSRDGPRVFRGHIRASAGEADVRAEWLSVERDLPSCQLGADPVPESEQRRGARAHPKPDNTRFSGRGEPAGVVDLDVEGRDAARSCLDRSRYVSKFGRLTEEGERDVHQFRLHATQRVKIRRAAERRFCDLRGKWERDEEPYPRRLEPAGSEPRGGQPCGLCFVRDKLRDEYHSEKTAEGCERGHTKALALRDLFPCVGDQSSHCGS